VFEASKRIEGRAAMMEKEATEKTTLRNKSIGTKVSEEEYAALEKLAEARGLTLGEWFRELVLAELR
jgi:hypothetical protein